MSDARCVLWMPDVNSFCVRCQILCGWMPDVNSFFFRCLDNHCCTAGCQKLAGWPSVCKIKPRSSSDVFLCLLLTVILAEAKDLLYGLLCLQGIRWLSTCEMSVGMASKERSIFWNFLCWMHVAKSFQPVLQETSRSSHCSEACLGPSCKMPDAGCGFSTRTVWLFLAMFPFFCLACCLIGIAPWHSGFAHWLWKCLRLCPDVLHSQELWAQILDPESCQQLATDTHFSCLIWPTCTWNATSCSWLCISTLSTVESLNCFADILQAVCDRGHHALQLFPSISFHLLAGLTCLMPVSLTPSTALTDILMHLAALGFSSDNPVRHALGHFPLVSCPMWVVRCELARNSARIEIALAVVWAFCGLQICAWLCLGNDWVVF